MSTEHDKIKRSTRLQKDENAVKKQLKIAKQHNSFADENKVIKEPHRLTKHHAMDCGNPKCLLCSREKVLGVKSIKERRSEQDLDNISDRRSNGLPNNEEK
jgi:hypothetical protein